MGRRIPRRPLSDPRGGPGGACPRAGPVSRRQRGRDRYLAGWACPHPCILYRIAPGISDNPGDGSPEVQTEADRNLLLLNDVNGSSVIVLAHPVVVLREVAFGL